MQCEDNSKLRTPLQEVCQTTDIGCVPIVDGRPDCNPQPDELPFAFDPKTTTLWLFSCKTREWVSFGKFKMCELSALNLDNITNICDILNIGVYFDAGSGCQQGTVTLGELAEKILDCLKLETKIITIGQGEGNKIKISIDGLPLDPVYVEGKNIWSEGGSGTEADPLVVATYDPICKWPTKTQAQVDAASTKHLGACVDGEMTRVPFPPNICELPVKTKEEFNAAQDKHFGICLDGEPSRVKVPCDFFLSKSDIPNLNIGNVRDLCDNFHMSGWYDAGQGICEKNVQFSISQLVDMISECIVEEGGACHLPVSSTQYGCTGRLNGSRDIQFNNVNLVPLNETVGRTNGMGIAIYQSRSFSWLKGSGDVSPQVETPIRNGLGQCKIELRNLSDCRALFEIETYASVYRSTNGMNRNEKFSVGCIAGVSPNENADLNRDIFSVGQGFGNSESAQVAIDSDSILASSYNVPDPENPGSHPVLDPYLITARKSEKSMINKRYVLAPGEELNLYLSFWIFIVGTQTEPIQDVNIGGYATSIVRQYRGIKF